MSEDIKIYHVETQEDYNDLMIKLEEQGYKWISGNKPTNKPEYWSEHKENTTVLLNRFQNYRMTRAVLNYHKRTYPLTPVIKHKAKGVEQMDKVVVPQFVADWYEERKDKYTIHGLIVELNKLNKKDNEKMYIWRRGCQGRHINKFSNAQEVIAKMHLFQDYEVEEKKYYWRKKKEYVFDFEMQKYTYLNVHKGTGVLSFGNSFDVSIFQTLFTETEIKELVSEEDFNKLERVEIDAN